MERFANGVAFSSRAELDMYEFPCSFPPRDCHRLLMFALRGERGEGCAGRYEVGEEEGACMKASMASFVRVGGKGGVCEKS